MSSSETRLNPRSGCESHRVRHRHDGKHLTVTFDSLDAAKAWRAVLDEPSTEVRRTVAEQVQDARPAGSRVDPSSRWCRDLAGSNETGSLSQGVPAVEQDLGEGGQGVNDVQAGGRSVTDTRAPRGGAIPIPPGARRYSQWRRIAVRSCSMQSLSWSPEPVPMRCQYHVWALTGRRSTLFRSFFVGALISTAMSKMPLPNTSATGPPTGSPPSHGVIGMYRLVHRVVANGEASCARRGPDSLLPRLNATRPSPSAPAAS